MSYLDTLRRLSSAEEFFEALGIDYDPQRLAVARLHILRRMGEYLAGSDLDGLDDGAAQALCRAHLDHAYRDFLASSPLAERVFKVHQDAARPAKKPFVPFSSLFTDKA